jgi:hypothetical protein
MTEPTSKIPQTKRSGQARCRLSLLLSNDPNKSFQLLVRVFFVQYLGKHPNDYEVLISFGPNGSVESGTVVSKPQILAN